MPRGVGRTGPRLSKVVEVVAGIALAASVGPASVPAVEGPPDGLRIALVDCADLPATAVRVLQLEARGILAPQGPGLRWRRVEPQEELEGGEVPVILLAGEYPVRRSRGVVLGGFEPRAVPPAVWVYARAVGREIGLTGSPATAGQAAQRALGVALGRVVAHELVHAMAPEAAHATSGLMAPAYDRRALVGPRPRLDPATGAALRAGLARWLGAGSEGDPSRAFFDLSQGRAPAAIVKMGGDASAAR